MDWINLKVNKCPQCNQSLEDAYEPAIKKFFCKCGFSITELRFKQIVAKEVEKELEFGDDERKHLSD